MISAVPSPKCLKENLGVLLLIFRGLEKKNRPQRPIYSYPCLLGFAGIVGYTRFRACRLPGKGDEQIFSVWNPSIPNGRTSFLNVWLCSRHADSLAQSGACRHFF